MNSSSPALDEWVKTFEGVTRDAPGLAGIDGRLLLEIEGRPVATLRLADGHVQLVSYKKTEPPPDAMVDFADGPVLVDVLSGKLNPVVAVLQGRLHTAGDLSLATKALLGLPVDKPFAVQETKHAH